MSDIKDLIKLPVRYVTGLYARGSLRDGDGLYLLQDDGTDDQSSDWHTERNEYIAKVLNEYPTLVQRLEKAEEIIEFYANGDHWHDGGDKYRYERVITMCAGNGFDKARVYLTEGEKK